MLLETANAGLVKNTSEHLLRSKKRQLVLTCNHKKSKNSKKNI